MSYQIKKFFVKAYLLTHHRCAWNLSRLITLDDQLDWMDIRDFKFKFGTQIAQLKRSIPDFVLEHFGLL